MQPVAGRQVCGRLAKSFHFRSSHITGQVWSLAEKHLAIVNKALGLGPSDGFLSGWFSWYGWEMICLLVKSVLLACKSVAYKKLWMDDEWQILISYTLSWPGVAAVQMTWQLRLFPPPLICTALERETMSLLALKMSNILSNNKDKRRLITQTGAENMSQSVKCLLDKQEDQSLDPQHPCKSMYPIHTCKPSSKKNRDKRTTRACKPWV